MKFVLKPQKFIIVLSTITIVCISIFFSGATWSKRKTELDITNDVISNQMISIGELASVKYMYTNMAKFQQKDDFYGWKIPFTTKSFIISYDGIIKAGVDIDHIIVEVKNKDIYITLPECEILSHEIDEDSINVFDESKNIFNPITITDYTNFSKEEKIKMEQKAIQNGILNDAKIKAKDTIYKMLQSILHHDDYKIIIN